MPQIYEKKNNYHYQIDVFFHFYDDFSFSRYVSVK